MARMFNDFIRCYEDGRVERLFKNKGWREVKQTMNNGYYRVGINGKSVSTHRIIGACFLGLEIKDLTKEIDHINRIGTDNRASNLRIATRQQQMFNRGEPKGYVRCRNGKKWWAKICLNRTMIDLGRYDTEEEAHQAYLEGKAKYHTF